MNGVPQCKGRGKASQAADDSVYTLASTLQTLRPIAISEMYVRCGELDEKQLLFSCKKNTTQITIFLIDIIGDLEQNA